MIISPSGDELLESLQNCLDVCAVSREGGSSPRDAPSTAGSRGQAAMSEPGAAFRSNEWSWMPAESSSDWMDPGIWSTTAGPRYSGSSHPSGFSTRREPHTDSRHKCPCLQEIALLEAFPNVTRQHRTDITCSGASGLFPEYVSHTCRRCI